MGKIQIVKGSETYTEGFKMKAVNPDGVIFRYLPNITKAEARLNFMDKAIENVLHPETKERKAVHLTTKKKTKIHEAFLIYMDGTLMREVVPKDRRKEKRDPDIFSATLTAIQNFITAQFTEGGLKTLQHGGLTLAIERGPQMFLVVVYTGPEPKKLRNKMRYSLIDIYDANKKQVKHWDGTESSLVDIEELLERIFEEEEE